MARVGLHSNICMVSYMVKCILHGYGKGGVWCMKEWNGFLQYKVLHWCHSNRTWELGLPSSMYVGQRRQHLGIGGHDCLVTLIKADCGLWLRSLSSIM